jgi:hypothetical protein
MSENSPDYIMNPCLKKNDYKNKFYKCSFYDKFVLKVVSYIEVMLVLSVLLKREGNKSYHLLGDRYAQTGNYCRSR